MGHAQDLEKRHARALQIAKNLAPNCLYLPASGGLSLTAEKSLEVGITSAGRAVYLRAVELNPLGTEAYGAIKDSFMVPYVLKHNGLIHSEFVIEGAVFDMHPKDIVNELRPITLCLSLSAGVPIFVPFVLRTSWASLPAFRNQGIEIYLTESGYEDPVSFAGASVTREMAAFVSSKVQTIRDLFANKKFQVAVDAYEACLKIGNKKVAIATAWTGIEAIFGINSELKFRTALYAASELAEANDPYQTFLDTMALYDVRSKVVHGSSIKPQELESAYGKSLGLLLALLRVLVGRGGLRTPKEIEQSLLSRK